MIKACVAVLYACAGVCECKVGAVHLVPSHLSAALPLTGDPYGYFLFNLAALPICMIRCLQMSQVESSIIEPLHLTGVMVQVALSPPCITG